MERTGFHFELIRSTLAEEDNVLTVTDLCDMAGVSRSGCYGWLKAERIRQEREERDHVDFQQILDASGSVVTTKAFGASICGCCTSEFG